MIARSYILATLKTLDRKYNKATSQKESYLYSKLALLELCGWIEESMDDIVIRHARRHLTEPKNISFVKENIVDSTHSFAYKNNFRQMLIRLIGIINVERIEKNVDQSKLSQLAITLVQLKQVRDPEAHTHIKGVTRHINAPSATLALFPALYEGLLELRAALKQAKF